MLDTRNVTGLKENDHDVILLFYTCAGSTSETSANKPFTQNLAYSTDGGNTFVKYQDNPLIEQIVPSNRDPKVIWYEPARCYIMVLYLDNHEFALFTSHNLLDWTQQQRIVLSEDAECPDFYPLPVDNRAVKWVFSAASVVIPGMPFASLMNLPQEMSLKTVHGEICLCAQPVQEINRLYGMKQVWENIAVDRSHPFSHCFESRCCDITVVANLQTLYFSHFACWWHLPPVPFKQSKLCGPEECLRILRWGLRPKARKKPYVQSRFFGAERHRAFAYRSTDSELRC